MGKLGCFLGGLFIGAVGLAAAAMLHSHLTRGNSCDSAEGSPEVEDMGQQAVADESHSESVSEATPA